MILLKVPGSLSEEVEELGMKTIEAGIQNLE
jgi:hypothetical protein